MGPAATTEGSAARRSAYATSVHPAGSSKRLRRTPIDPSVPHHSIVLQLKHPTTHGRGDGVVPYESSHLPSASSEVLVPGFHLEVGKQGVTDELRRILRTHLQEAGADLPAGRPGQTGG